MSEDTTQAVVEEANAAAKPAAEATSARVETADDLDSLLKEFDTTEKAAEPTKPEQNAGAADDQTQREPQNGRLAAIEQRLFKQDMQATIKNVRGDLPSEVFDDDLVGAWIDAEARKDPRLATAWVNRDSNPKQFQKVVEQLGRNFSKKYGKLPDANATEDRAAVTAAVRGASTKAPEGKAPDYSRMSDAELRAEKEKLGM
jgi:hypothetical protein